MIKLQVNSPEAEIQIHYEYLCTGSRSYSNWSRNWICLADHLNQGPLTRRNYCPRSHFVSIIPRMSPNLGQNPSPKDKIHDDVIKWKRFTAQLVLCAGNSPVPVNSPHKGQWRGALVFSLICVWINCWVNNREAGDLRRYRGYYDVIVMYGLDTNWALVD